MLPQDDFLEKKLQERREVNALRSLQKVQKNLIDFSSNDYLGFAKNTEIHQKTTEKIAQLPSSNGSTGSRLLTGNSEFAEKLEAKIALFHQAEAALLYNSGYDANVGLMSCIAQKNDTIISDSLIHASLIDGIRLNHAKNFKFAHNNLKQLEQKLKIAQGNIFVVVESIYSMDGDAAPLIEISEICEKYKAKLIVDEAHAVGIFGDSGTGWCHQLNIQRKIFARIITYGKAMGCHGAAILGSTTLKEYLINFSRSFIYTTAAPIHHLASIESAYEQLTVDKNIQQNLFSNIDIFKSNLKNLQKFGNIESNSAIQSIIIGNNTKCKQIAEKLLKTGLDVRPILSPTVPIGTERLRICLHAYNTFEEIKTLTTHLINYCSE